MLVSDRSDEGTLDGAAIDGLRKEGVRFEFGGHTAAVFDADQVVLSPGIPVSAPIVVQLAERGVPIVGEIEVAAARCPGKIVGITGTNGKTTTTELVGFCCRVAGEPGWIAGNVGIPLSESGPNVGENEVVALELSSFQLETIDQFRPSVAVLLNVTPDHLDRYDSFDDYGRAKLGIYRNMMLDDLTIYNVDDPWLRKQLADQKQSVPSSLLPFSVEQLLETGAWIEDGVIRVRLAAGEASIDVVGVDELGLVGPHNLSNALAASLALLQLGVDRGAIAEGLRTFRGLPHRLEEIAMIDGVIWVNDSKGTNIEATLRALESYDRPIVLIAGGRGKENDYAVLDDAVSARVKRIIAIGEDAPAIVRAFEAIVPVEECGDQFSEAIDRAAEAAESGDVVLLSPACASFDMFRNFEVRGDEFRRLVATRTDQVTAGLSVAREGGENG